MLKPLPVRPCCPVPHLWKPPERRSFAGKPLLTVVLAHLIPCRARRRRRESFATFEDLNVQCTGDVVKHYLHTTILAAELLRGPGGRAKAFPSQHITHVLYEARDICKAFLPQALRQIPLAVEILELLASSLESGDPERFRGLEMPLLRFHNQAPPQMRKALQARMSLAASKLGCPEAYPLSVALDALATAVKGPQNVKTHG